jgi:hypothetical protein
MANDRDAMLREIDSELRRDQLMKMWDRYGVYVIAGVALLFASVAGFKWWEGNRIAAAQQAGARYEAALLLQSEGKSDEARQALQAIVKDAPANYAALARLQLAAKANTAGNKDEALAIYEDIAAGGQVDPLLRDYARLQSAALKLDTADFTEMQNRLNPLMAAGNAWSLSARELFGLAAYRAGRMEEARQTFLELAADPKTPASMRERVGLVMALITAAEGSQGAPAAGGAPAEAAPKVQ